MENETLPTPSPTNTTPTAPPEVTKTPRKSRRIIFLSVISFLVLLLVGSALYLTTKNAPEKESKQVATVPTTPITPPEELETYTNEKYGFSFKYPKGWIKEDILCDVESFCLSIRGVDTIPTVYKGSFSGGRLTKKIYLEDKQNIDKGEFPVTGTALNPRIITVNGRHMVQTLSWGLLGDQSEMYRLDNLGEDPNKVTISKKEHYILSTEALTDKVEITFNIILPIDSLPAQGKLSADDVNTKKAEEISEKMARGEYENKETEEMVTQYQNMLSSLTFN